MKDFAMWWMSVGCALYIIGTIHAVFTQGPLFMLHYSWREIGRGALGIPLWPLVYIAYREGYVSPDDMKVIKRLRTQMAKGQDE